VTSVVPAIALTGEATAPEAKDRCLERWIALGCPTLDYPGAALFWLRPDPIADLAAWFASASSVAACLYVASSCGARTTRWCVPCAGTVKPRRAPVNGDRGMDAPISPAGARVLAILAERYPCKRAPGGTYRRIRRR
jgi:hypothetical protein